MIYFPVCAIITMLLITTEPLNMIDKIVRLYLQKYLRKYNYLLLPNEAAFNHGGSNSESSHIVEICTFTR